MVIYILRGINNVDIVSQTQQKALCYNNISLSQKTDSGTLANHIEH